MPIIWNEPFESDNLGKGGWHSDIWWKRCMGQKKVENHCYRIYKTSLVRVRPQVPCTQPAESPRRCEMYRLQRLGQPLHRPLDTYITEIVCWQLAVLGLGLDTRSILVLQSAKLTELWYNGNWIIAKRSFIDSSAPVKAAVIISVIAPENWGWARLPFYTQSWYTSQRGTYQDTNTIQSIRKSAHYVTNENRKIQTKKKKKLRGLGPRANYADRATAASWRSSANFCE
jgi:hypothetical protein